MGHPQPERHINAVRVLPQGMRYTNSGTSFGLNAGHPALHSIRNGGEDHSLAVHPQAAERIRVYLEAAGHANAEKPLER